MTKEEAVQQLERALAALLSEETFQRFLAFRANFHQYSWHNRLLIMMQRPGATRVAGYKTWQTLGRQVKKGEQGLAIFAPILIRAKATSRSPAEADADSEAPAGELIRGFRVVHVFDVSQTEGESLPDPPQLPQRLSGDDQGLLGELRAAAQRLRVQVMDGVPETPGANGEYSPAEHLIRLRPDLPPLQKAKTLAHEFGHALLHRGVELSREVKEVEAESVAYVVLACAGFDAGEFSLSYLAQYTSDTKTLTRQVGRILDAADRILSALSPIEDQAHAA